DDCTLAVGDDNDGVITFTNGYSIFHFGLIFPVRNVAQQRYVTTTHARLGIGIAGMLAQPVVDIEEHVEHVTETEKGALPPAAEEHEREQPYPAEPGEPPRGRAESQPSETVHDGMGFENVGRRGKWQKQHRAEIQYPAGELQAG